MRFQSATARARWVRYIEILHVKLLRRLNRHKYITTYAISIGTLVDAVVLAFFAGDNPAASILLIIDVLVKVAMKLFETRSSLAKDNSDLDRQERTAKKAISDTIQEQRQEKKRSQAEEDPHTRADKLFEDFSHALGHTNPGDHFEELVRHVRTRFAPVDGEERVGEVDKQQRRRASLLASTLVPTTALVGTSRFVEQYEGLGGTTRS